MLTGAPTQPLTRIAAALELTPCQAAILHRLYRAGTWVPSETLNSSTAAYSRKFDHAAPLRKINNVQVHVRALRVRFGDDVILSYWGRGYTLGAPGVKLVRRALTEARTEAA